MGFRVHLGLHGIRNRAYLFGNEINPSTVNYCQSAGNLSQYLKLKITQP